MALKKLTLFHVKNDRTAHGGGLYAGKRKQRRPFVPKKWMHLVMRSKEARGELNLLRPQHAEKIGAILRKQARKHLIHLCEYVNVGNHLHVKVKAFSRSSLRAFLISVPALIARAVTGARKGRPWGRRFWDALVFTRVLHSRFEVIRLDHYFEANEVEASYGKEARAWFLNRGPPILAQSGRRVAR